MLSVNGKGSKPWPRAENESHQANLGLQTDLYSTFSGFNLLWDLGDIFKKWNSFLNSGRLKLFPFEMAFLAISQFPICTKILENVL